MNANERELLQSAGVAVTPRFFKEIWKSLEIQSSNMKFP